MPEQANGNYRILKRKHEDLPCEAAADAHHSEPQLEGTEVVSEGALDPQLRLHLRITGILFEQDLGKLNN